MDLSFHQWWTLTSPMVTCMESTHGSVTLKRSVLSQHLYAKLVQVKLKWGNNGLTDYFPKTFVVFNRIYLLLFQSY